MSLKSDSSSSLEKFQGKFGGLAGAVISSYSDGEYELYVVDAGRLLPQEVIELRTQVYVNEWKIMTSENIVGNDDDSGIHVIVFHRSSSRFIACTHMMPAEYSTFVIDSGIGKQKLNQSVLSSRSAVIKEFRSAGIFQLLIYAATRHYRIEGRRYVVAYVDAGDHPTHRRFNMTPLKSAQSKLVQLADRDLKLQPYVSSVEYALHKASANIPEEIERLIAIMIPDEIEKRVKKLSSSINNSSIWRRAREGSLTRNQYAEFLAQLHHFVRNTTRVLALAVSRSEEKSLRSHFRKHLNEELDHELIIEADLRCLGVDVEYLLNRRAPTAHICNFNGLQEALLANRHDPVMYMAIPFAVEGISAFISETNMEALRCAAAKWGISDPVQATRFLTSHRSFDGQDGGHWEMTLAMIKKFIKTDDQCELFMAIAKATVENIRNMIEEVVGPEDYESWSELKHKVDSNFQLSPVAIERSIL